MRDEQDGIETGEPFLNRWSRRKQQANPPQAEEVEETRSAEAEIEPPPLTDADMPPLESLDEHSDYTGFLSPEVTEELRQLALQKLFRSACFNVCDGLDDYAEDYTSFEKLGNLMTADLRFRLQQEAQRTATAEAAQTGPDAGMDDASTQADELAQGEDAAETSERAPADQSGFPAANRGEQDREREA